MSAGDGGRFSIEPPPAHTGVHMRTGSMVIPTLREAAMIASERAQSKTPREVSITGQGISRRTLAALTALAWASSRVAICIGSLTQPGSWHHHDSGLAPP